MVKDIITNVDCLGGEIFQIHSEDCREIATLRTTVTSLGELVGIVESRYLEADGSPGSSRSGIARQLHTQHWRVSGDARNGLLSIEARRPAPPTTVEQSRCGASAPAADRPDRGATRMVVGLAAVSVMLAVVTLGELPGWLDRREYASPPIIERFATRTAGPAADCAAEGVQAARPTAPATPVTPPPATAAVRVGTEPRIAETRPPAPPRPEEAAPEVTPLLEVSTVRKEAPSLLARHVVEERVAPPPDPTPEDLASRLRLSGPYELAEVDVPPRATAREMPVYTKKARRKKHQGRVELNLLIDEQGLVSAMQLEKSIPGSNLNEAVIDSVRQWRFVPAHKSDVPVSVWNPVAIEFSIDSGRTRVHLLE